MIILGITGGVGAGKSTVLQYLSQHCHAHIIEADQMAKELMKPGGGTYLPLLSLLGPGILNPDGTIHRGKMAEAMYQDSELVRQVDAIVHPMVKKSIEDQLAQSQAPVTVIESALIEEGNLLPLCHYVWFIQAEEAVRIQRLEQSRGYSLEKCRSIIANQKTDAEFSALADTVICNSGSPEETCAQIRRVMHSYGLEVT